jgi:hypothetical protein
VFSHVKTLCPCSKPARNFLIVLLPVCYTQPLFYILE